MNMFEQLWTREEIGQRLKEERRRLGLSQEEFATAGGIRRSTLYQYERGDRRPSLDFLLKTVSAGVDLNFMIFGKRDVRLVDEIRLERRTLDQIYAIVDRYARDPRGRALAIEHRQDLFRQLCAIVEQQPEEDVDWDKVEKVAEAFAA